MHAAPETHDEIHAQPQPRCYLCGSVGARLYERVPDRLFGVPGYWSHRWCQNPLCNLVWLDPMPLEGDIGKAYRQYYTHPNQIRLATHPGPARRLFDRLYWKLNSLACNGYIQTRYSYNQGVGKPWHRLFASCLSIYPPGAAAGDLEAGYLHRPASGGRLLEVGFGSAERMTKMQKLGWSVEGVETDGVAVGAARARGLKVHLGGLSEVAFADASFEAVFMSHVLEHVHDPVGLLRECRRILKPTGQLVVLTPNAGSFGHRLFGAAWLNLDPPRHLMLFAPASLRQATERANLSVIRIFTSARLAKHTWTVSRLIQTYGRVERPEGWEQWSGAASVAYAFLERAAMMVWPSAGEELVLIAAKP